MLYIPLDRSAKRTYIKQIYYELRKRILSGELAPGEALPSYRELSQELKVSKNTVLAAYDMLVADGVLHSVVGSGFYVEDGIKRPSPAPPLPHCQSAALSDQVIPDGTINFDNGQPALELFPRAKWSKAMTKAMMEAPSTALGYDMPQGRPELRKELCNYLYKTQGLTCEPEQIIITNGAKQAITLVAECMLHTNKEVWIEDPFPAMLKQMLSCHTERIRPFFVDPQGIDPKTFPGKGNPTLIIVSPMRQFPTGAIMPMKRRIALTNFAVKTGAYILEDHFESEFNYDTPPASSLYELDSKHVISIGTFSKVMYPSIRLGYMVVPPELIPLLCKRKQLSDHHTDSITQLAMVDFLKTGALEKHLRRMKREYRNRRDHLTQCLQEQFGKEVHISGTAAGMNLIAAFDHVDFTQDRIQMLLKHQVYAVPVETQATQKGQHLNELILRYSGLTKEELTIGTKRLRDAISTFTEK